ncbi:type IVB secretion system protein IcmH/DotU [Chitinibacteraceae bacterium HSL-7]
MTTSTLETPSTFAVAQSSTPSLREMMEDGIYLLFLLRDDNAPSSASEFNRRIDGFLAQFERNARQFSKAGDQIEGAKYAFCALLDEIVLASNFPIRDEWERMPLQLRLFGEHLAGEGFFDRLEMIRMDPKKNIEVLEVFYSCLLLGFEGKYLLEGKEKLGFLTQRVGQEIEQVRGGVAPFAPNWKPAQRFKAYVRHELPMWLYFALLALVAAGLFAGYRFMLSRQLGAAFGI